MGKDIIAAALLAKEVMLKDDNGKPFEPNYITEQPLLPEENAETAPETEISGRRKFQFGVGSIPKSPRPPHGEKPESQAGR